MPVCNGYKIQRRTHTGRPDDPQPSTAYKIKLIKFCKVNEHIYVYITGMQRKGIATVFRHFKHAYCHFQFVPILCKQLK